MRIAIARRQRLSSLAGAWGPSAVRKAGATGLLCGSEKAAPGAPALGCYKRARCVARIEGVGRRAELRVGACPRRRKGKLARCGETANHSAPSATMEVTRAIVGGGAAESYSRIRVGEIEPERVPLETWDCAKPPSKAAFAGKLGRDHHP